MQALAAFVESGFSRIPIYEESIDSVVGLLYAKDILTVLKNRRRPGKPDDSRSAPPDLFCARDQAGR